MSHFLSDFSNLCVFGGTSEGKSTWTRHLIEEADNLFPTPPSKIHFVFQFMDDDLKTLQQNVPNMTVSEKVPSESELYDLTANQPHTLLIIDDCLDLGSNPIYCKLLCVLSHHLKMSIVLCCHQMTGAKNWSMIHRNLHTYILMSSVKNNCVLMQLGRLTGNYKFLKEIFRDINMTQGPFSYLVINVAPQHDTKLRYVSSIFKQDKHPPIIYSETM